MDVKFNKKIFERLLKLNKIRKQDSILAVGALKAERDLFVELGFKNVTISNITKTDSRAAAPFKFIRQDVKKITLPNNSFDFVFVSASLHHCSSPVGALLEMYRVAKKGIIIIEPRDSSSLRFGQKIKLIPEYELAAVIDSDFTHGGVNNTEIPNYVYRWTERELKKIVSSFNPVGEHKFIFFYKFNPSFSQTKLMGHKIKYYSLKTCASLVKPFVWLFKKQGNSFGAVIFKPRIPRDLFPWLKLKGKKIVFDRSFKKFKRA
jgi:SAM-dependent methyltransferase